MPETETTDAPSEFFEIRINKRLVKKVVTAVAATAAVVGVVFAAKNLSSELETSTDAEITEA